MYAIRSPRPAYWSCTYLLLDTFGLSAADDIKVRFNNSAFKISYVGVEKV